MGSRLTALVCTGLAAGLALTACGSEEPEPEIPRVTQPTDLPSQPTPSSDGTDQSPGGQPRVAGTVADGLAVPWGIDFLTDTEAIVTERDTKRVLSVSTDGEVTELGVIEAARPQGEAGLLGVAVPDGWEDGDAVYLYVTTEDDNRVLRVPVSLADDSLGDVEVVLDGIPQGFIHDGGRIAFGPDGYLYASTGEAGSPELAQDPASLGGKILRIDAETGEPAPDNPDPGSPVWTSGHRNVQGLAWDDADRLWASEFGDSTWDELNLIERGQNYGWPQAEGTGGEPEFTDPHLVWPVEAASPSGLAWADGHLWMAGLRGQRLWRIEVRDGRAHNPKPFLADEYGRLRTVVSAPDGSLWVTTSNQDGRGDPAPSDDRILRLTLG